MYRCWKTYWRTIRSRMDRPKTKSLAASEKGSFDENKDAAMSFVTKVSILINASKVLEKGKNKKEVVSTFFLNLLPLLPKVAASIN